VIRRNDFTSLQDVERSVDEEFLINKYTGLKRSVVAGILNGYSFRQVSQMYQVKESQVYKIKRELKSEYKETMQEYKTREQQLAIRQLFDGLPLAIRELPLTRFADLYIYPYYPEAVTEGWVTTNFQNTLNGIWDKHNKTVTMSGRDQLKTFTLLIYLIKKLIEREYPIEINYYHLSKEVAREKYNLMRRLIENSPILAELLQLEDTRSDTATELQLSDGSIVKAMSYGQGVIGKHPTIIALDDVIDSKVIYSEDRNKKAVDKFYTDILPMIGRDQENKKVIIIGTPQKKNDLYQSLPSDYHYSEHPVLTKQGKSLSPEIYSVKAWAKKKKDISSKFGERFWLKEYMCRPFEALGSIISPEYIQYYDQLPKDDTATYIGADLSVGKKPNEGDFTSIVVIDVVTKDGTKNVYVREVYRARIRLSQRVNKLKEMINNYKPTRTGVEDVSFQYDTISEARRKHLLAITSVSVSNSKTERYNDILEPLFENKQVYIKPDMNDFRLELLSLPSGEHDDMADALVIALKVAGYGDTPKIRQL